MASREAEIKRRTNPAQRGAGRMLAGILNKVANESKSEGRSSPKPVTDTSIDFPMKQFPPEDDHDCELDPETDELSELKAELRKLHTFSKTQEDLADKLQLEVANLTEELRIVTAQCKRQEPEGLRDILLYKRDKNNEIKKLNQNIGNYKDQINMLDQKCSILSKTVEKLKSQHNKVMDSPEIKTQIRAIQIEKAIEIGKLRGALSKEKVNMEAEIKILQDEIRRLKQTKSVKSEGKEHQTKKPITNDWFLQDRMQMDREEHRSPAFQKLERERNNLRTQITDKNMQLAEATIRLSTCTKIEIQNQFLRKENAALKSKAQKENELNLPEKYNILLQKYNALEVRFADLNRRVNQEPVELEDYEEMVELNSSNKREAEKVENGDSKVLKME